MARIYRLIKDDLGRFRSAKQISDPAVTGVYALIEGLRAGQAEFDRLKLEARQAVKAAKAKQRQETRTKLGAFVLFDLMAGAMIYVMYAGIVG